MLLSRALSFIVLPALVAADISPYGHGFRGDGSGVYPDSHPPTTWSDTSNLVWKSRLPNWGYSSPVPVAGKVFFIAEPFQPRCWPSLCCYDDATGSLLWQRDIDPFDALPQVSASERQALTADVGRIHDQITAAYRICSSLLSMGGVPEGDPRLVDINKALGQHGLRLDGYRPGYGLLRALHHIDEKAHQASISQLRSHGVIPLTTWWNQGPERVGTAFPTPVSDGERVCVMTVHGTVACYDMQGKLLWTRSSGYRLPRCTGLIPSPRLAGDLLLTHWNTEPENLLIAWDKKSGKQAWSTALFRGEGSAGPHGVKFSREGGSPVVMTLGDVPVVILGSGHVVRLPDGMVFDARLPCHLPTVAVDDARDAIYGLGMADAGAERWCFELVMKGDSLVRTRRWVHVENTAGSPVFAGGRLFAPRAQIDVATGLYLGSKDPSDKAKKVPQSAPNTRHLLLVAGDHVYGLRQERLGDDKKQGPMTGIAEVFTLNGTKVAENRLSAGSWDEESTARWAAQGFRQDLFSYACAMNIGGNRLYIASQDFLFCIGAATGDGGMEAATR